MYLLSLKRTYLLLIAIADQPESGPPLGFEPRLSACKFAGPKRSEGFAAAGS